MKKVFMMLAAMAATLSLSAQTPSEITAVCGEEVMITATADEGYEFEKWQDGNTVNPRTITISSDLEVLEYVASFKAKTMTILATVNEEEWGEITGTLSAKVGEQVTIKAEAKSSCYRFVKWSDDVLTAERTITVGVNDAANTFVAIFEQVEFTVKATAGAHGSVSISK